MPARPVPVAPPLSHSIARADCLEYLAALPESSVDVITTDPAYSGMNEHMSFGHGRIVGAYSDPERSKWFREFRDDPETFLELLRLCHRALRPDRHIYVMFDSFSLLSLAPLMREVFDVKCVIVWDKVNLGMGHYFRRRHEFIVFATKGKRRLNRRDMPDVWPVKRVHRGAYPTQKPVELFERMLLGSVDAGMTVCDPFVGSGSSAIAALRAGCIFTGADVSEDAVALATNRCETFISSGTDPLERHRS